MIEDDKERIKDLCDKTYKYGNTFEKGVARTVASQRYTCSRRQESILCQGASFKGASPFAHYQGIGWEHGGFDF